MKCAVWATAWFGFAANGAATFAPEQWFVTLFTISHDSHKVNFGFPHHTHLPHHCTGLCDMVWQCARQHYLESLLWEKRQKKALLEVFEAGR